MLKKLSILFLLTAANVGYSVMELSFEFSYDKSVYGTERENEQLTRSYTISLATYFWKNTALEFNFMTSDEIDTVNTDVALDNDLVLRGTYSKVETIVYGIGFRQALGSRKSFIRPLISLGYARQLVTSDRSFRYEDTGTSATATIFEPTQKLRDDSVFGSFIIQMNLTRLIKLSGSVKTVFPAFDFNEAKNNMIYSLGMTWIF